MRFPQSHQQVSLSSSGDPPKCCHLSLCFGITLRSNLPLQALSFSRKAILTFLGLCLLNGLVAIGSTGSSSTPATKVQQTTGETSAPASSPPRSGAVPVVATDTDHWSYDDSTDEMTGKRNTFACTKSTNELQFSFPYSGGTSGELCFRKKGKSLNAYLRVSSGQFSCGIEDCSLKFKFDDGPIQSFSGAESSTHETGFLFVEPEQRLLNSVLKSKKLKIQADYYQEGRQVLLFDISGLDIKKL